MWIVVLLSSLCSLSRFNYMESSSCCFFQNKVSRQGDHSCRMTRETSHIKFLLAINLFYF